MKTTIEQMAFIRAHGIMHCPPGPVVGAGWSDVRKTRKGAGKTEAQMISAMVFGRFRWLCEMPGAGLDGAKGRNAISTKVAILAKHERNHSDDPSRKITTLP